MAGPAEVLKPSKNSQEMAMLLAMVVRNAMEDFHCKYLTDNQMKELNPIIRNAIYTGLQAMRHYERSEGAKCFLNFQKTLIPAYWEEAELLQDFIDSVRRQAQRKTKKKSTEPTTAADAASGAAE